MSDRTSRTCWLLVLAMLLATPLRADEKPAPSPAPQGKTSEQQEAAANAPDIEKEISSSIGMKLVLIRAGNFRMGSPESEKTAFSNEKPQHRVRIKNPFYLGKYEVTRGQFRKFVTATKYKTDAEKDGKGCWGFTGKNDGEIAQKPEFTWRSVGFEQTEDHPVVNVSWNDAVAFCEWLSKQEGNTYRLPTEVEWEWACRGGTFDRWNCGDKEKDLKASANIADASLKAKWAVANWAMDWDDNSPFTSAVGKYKANQFGLHDMHGNVSEWCNDWFDPKYYVNSPMNDPQGPATGLGRVHRGGSWSGLPLICRSASRHSLLPSNRSDGLGFRVVRVLPAAK